MKKGVSASFVVGTSYKEPVVYAREDEDLLKSEEGSYWGHVLGEHSGSCYKYERKSFELVSLGPKLESKKLSVGGVDEDVEVCILQIYDCEPVVFSEK